jgi:hypothetical protein
MRRWFTATPSSHLVNTIRLGVHVFNPFRFNGVLKALARDNAASQLAPEELGQYWNAAVRCFSNPSNVKLVPVKNVVETMVILRRNFPEQTVDVYETLRSSLASTVNTRSKLVELVVSVERTGLVREDPLLVQDAIVRNLDVVRINDWHRINLVHYAPDPKEYLGFLAKVTEKTFIEKLTEEQIVTVLTVGGEIVSSNFTEVLESKLESRFRDAESSDVIKKLNLLSYSLSLGAKGDPRGRAIIQKFVNRLSDIVDVASPVQSVDILCVFPPPSLCGKAAFNNLKWRLERDPNFLSSLDGLRVARFLRTIPQVVDTTAVKSLFVNALISPLQRSRIPTDILVKITEAFAHVSARPWIEQRDFSEVVFSRIVSLGFSASHGEEIKKLIMSVMDGLEVNDVEIARRFLYKFSPAISDEIIAAIESSVAKCSTDSRVGNLILSALLSKESNDFEKIIASVKATGSVPLHAQLVDLSSGQIVILLDMIDDDRLADLELVAEAAGLQLDEALENQLELVVQLAKRGMPCKALVDSVARRIIELPLNDRVGFLVACSRTRVVPESFSLGDFLSSVARADGSAQLWSEAVESLSHLGLLVKETETSRLLDIFLDSCACLGSIERSRLSGKVLAAMFLSLKVPNEKQMFKLVEWISEDFSAVDQEYMQVIAEMNTVVEHSVLSEALLRLDWSVFNTGEDSEDEWLRIFDAEGRLFEKNIRVGLSPLSRVDLLNGKDAVMIARPEDMTNDGSLTQLFKFKVFLIQELRAKNVEVRNWVSLDSRLKF